MAEGVRIVRQTTENGFDKDTGAPFEQIRIEFKVDDDGPFYRRFPVEGFTGIAARAQLEEFARELRLLKG